MEPLHWEIVQKILAKYPYSFYAFGSRVKDNPKELSDLGLVFFDEISINTLTHIDEDFEESDLSYKVDIINWNKISDNFREAIKKDLVKVQ